MDDSTKTRSHIHLYGRQQRYGSLLETPLTLTRRASCVSAISITSSGGTVGSTTVQRTRKVVCMEKDDSFFHQSDDDEEYALYDNHDDDDDDDANSSTHGSAYRRVLRRT